MRSPSTVPVIALMLGVFATFLGSALVGGYVLEAVVARLGAHDQSLLFWYLPILLLGVPVLAAGIAACTWAIIRLRRIRDPGGT